MDLQKQLKNDNVDHMSKKFWDNISAKHKNYRQSARLSMESSNRALANAKRAIFALHRGDIKECGKLLESAAKELFGLEQFIRKDPLLAGEGAYRAAMEEFTEAALFLQFIENKELGQVKPIEVRAPEIYIAGLADLTGEVARYAVARASRQDKKEVLRAQRTAEWIIAYLLGMDLTGYLRTKFDQAKNGLRRIEDIVYDLSLRR